MCVAIVALCFSFGIVSADEREERVLGVLDLRAGQDVADIGCGTGWLSEEIAKVVSPGGRCYAVEIRESMIERIRRRNFPGVIPVHSIPEDIKLPKDSIDVAVLHDVASHVKKTVRPAFYASIVRALRPKGRLVIFGPHGKAARMLIELRRYRFIPEDDAELSRLSDRELDRRLKRGIRFRYRGMVVF